VRFLLDTNACIALLNGTSPTLAAQVAGVPPHEFAVSAVTEAELRYGAHRSARAAANLRVLEEFLDPLPSLAFDRRAAPHYGRIRAELTARGTPIGPNDLRIAATALAHDLTVVTRNTREFERVVGLRVEDWEASGD
jgi:tRNA(fMet)-specific endonuclease VapC